VMAASLDVRVDAARTLVLNRRVRLIVAATIAYNVVEAVVAITAGALASSAALIAFGLDSLVEVTSAAAVAWQFTASDPKAREHVTLRLIAGAFFALAAYVTYEAVIGLVGPSEAEHSSVGIGLAAVSVVVMPVLSWLERRTGRELRSSTVVADSKQTLICAWLSGVLLVGLVTNSLLGWSWIDPVAALIIAVVALREGIQALRGDTCCTPAAALVAEPALADDACDDGCC
jgi:divalent metal cation (Fe/Co/Zn/Cd) transporter